MGLGAALGGLLGMAAGAAGFVVAGFTAGTMWMVGAAVGSLFDKPDTDFNLNSPTYSFGPIQNTKSQKLPVPLVYGKARLAGNIIMQNFLDAKKTRQDMLVGLGLGEFNSISDVKANELSLSTDPPEGCSLNVYYGTPDQTANSRSLGGRRYPNTAYLAMTLKASEKLSGNPTITSIVEGRKVWTPNGTRFTRNPAWIVYDILTGKYWDPEKGREEPVGLGLPHEVVDLESFQAAAAYCDELVDGEPRFTLDYVIDTQRSAIDHLTDILSCFRGALIARDKIALYIDKPVSAPYKAIGLDDILQGSFTWWQRAEDEVFNRVVIEWVDPENYWEQVVSVFEDEDSIAERGIIEKRYSLNGITRAAQAQRMGAYLIDVSNGSMNVCQFGLSIKDSDIEAGDVISITHDLPGWENKWFRVLTVDDREDDTIVVTATEYVAEAYNDRALDIVRTIDTNIPNPFVVYPPRNLQVREWGFKTKSGAHIANLDLSWDPPAEESARVRHYAVYTTYNNERKLQGTTEETVFTVKNLPIIADLLVEVESVSIYDDHSTPLQIHTAIIGINEPPPAPLSVVAAQRGDRVVVDGIIPVMNDLKCLECRIGFSEAWEDALYVGQPSGFPFEIAKMLDGTYYILVKTIDYANQHSLDSTNTTITLDDINERLNVILERDDIELGSPGTLVNLEKQPSGYLRSVTQGQPSEYISPPIDTGKVSKTDINFDFQSYAATEVSFYSGIQNWTYGHNPDYLYGSLTLPIMKERTVRFSDDNVNWSEWENYIAGEKTFRYIQFSYNLIPDGVPIYLEITRLKQLYDVPDIEIVTTQNIPVGGRTFNFETDFGKSFNAVPEAIIPTVLSNIDVRPTVTSITETGCTVTCYDASGNSVAQSVQLIIRGY